MTPPRRLSGGDTFFAKFVIPPGFVAAALFTAWMTAQRLAHPEANGHPLLRMVLDLAAIGLGAPVAWLAFRLKQVAIDGDFLRVSNFVRQVVVPLRDIDGVDQASGLGAGVVVRFATDTAFGRSIVFSPPGLTHPNPHPVVTELRAAIAVAKGQ